MIKTIKQNETYYTFDDEHDDPDKLNLHYKFPNEQVGIGLTKQESQEAYRIIAQSNTDIKAWAIWLQSHSVNETYKPNKGE